MKERTEDQSKLLHHWFQNNQVERTKMALERNGFKVSFHADNESAVKAILEMIPDDATVGVGGSMTLHQIGFYEQINNRKGKLINPKDVKPEQAHEVSRQLFLCDYFVSGTNAITEEGHLFNIDATGNRVAPMIFGPKKIIIVCSVNKIVKDSEEARKRVFQKAAPMNAKRLGRKTPCTATGICSDCNSPERICNVSVELLKKPIQSDIHILLVGNLLGL